MILRLPVWRPYWFWLFSKTPKAYHIKFCWDLSQSPEKLECRKRQAVWLRNKPSEPPSSYILEHFCSSFSHCHSRKRRRKKRSHRSLIHIFVWSLTVLTLPQLSSCELYCKNSTSVFLPMSPRFLFHLFLFRESSLESLKFFINSNQYSLGYRKNPGISRVRNLWLKRKWEFSGNFKM